MHDTPEYHQPSYFWIYSIYGVSWCISKNMMVPSRNMYCIHTIICIYICTYIYTVHIYIYTVHVFQHIMTTCSIQKHPHSEHWWPVSRLEDELQIGVEGREAVMRRCALGKQQPEARLGKIHQKMALLNGAFYGKIRNYSNLYMLNKPECFKVRLSSIPSGKRLRNYGKSRC